VKAVMDSKEQPFARWSELADQLPGRVGKQIRDRWINHLNPDINHLPFSRDDDMLLWTAHTQVGKKWVEIAASFFKSSRSENQLKNRWHSAAFKQVIADEFGPNTYDSGVAKSLSSDQSCSSIAGKGKMISAPKGQQQNVYNASDTLLV
jgi:Myb-like DNA-binding domain